MTDPTSRAREMAEKIVRTHIPETSILTRTHGPMVTAITTTLQSLMDEHKAEVERLNDALQTSRDLGDELRSALSEALARAERAESALAEARREERERAAAVLDKYSANYAGAKVDWKTGAMEAPAFFQIIAEAIRALPAAPGENNG